MTEQRRIGHRAVSAVGIGAANWSLRGPLDDKTCSAIVREAIERGITLFDTAMAYTTADESGHNERLIARALRDVEQSSILVATKGGHFRRGDEFPIDGRPDSLRRHCEASLVALDRERLDLYFLHRPDPRVPIEESVGALAELRAEGKIDLVGVSNVTPDLYRRAAEVTRIDAVENEFSPYQQRDLPFIEALAEDGVAYLAYSPLGGRLRRSQPLPAFEKAAASTGRSVAGAVLDWERALAPNLIPIVGVGSLSSLRSL